MQIIFFICILHLLPAWNIMTVNRYFKVHLEPTKKSNQEKVHTSVPESTHTRSIPVGPLLLLFRGTINHHVDIIFLQQRHKSQTAAVIQTVTEYRFPRSFE